MSAYAKSVVAAVAAILVAGITAWQAAASDGFQVLDLLPIAIGVANAALTWLVPNVPQLPWAKAGINGALAVLTALATFVSGHPAEVDVANLLVVGLGALLVWYVPNLEPAPRSPDGAWQVTDAREITDVLRDLPPEWPAPGSPEPPTAPIPTVSGWLPPAPGSSADEPTPIGEEAAAATGRQPAVPDTTS